MRLSSLTSGLFLAIVLALTGCGGDDGGDSGSDDNGGSSSGDAGDAGDSGDSGDSGDDGPLDVCALVTTADLEKLFGSPFEDGELVHHEETGGDQCTWGNTDGPPVKVISINVLREGHLAEMFTANDLSLEEFFDQTKSYMSDVEELDLGDESYRSGALISVLEGDALYDISGTGTSPEAIEGLKRLAEQVIG